MDLDEVLDRIDNAIRQLDDLRRVPYRSLTDVTRISGKIEGLALAKSYLREYKRHDD